MRTASDIIFIICRASEWPTGYLFYPFMEHAFLTGKIVSSVICIFWGVSSYVQVIIHVVFAICLTIDVAVTVHC